MGIIPRPTITDTNYNGNCIIWIYVLAYIYMPLSMIPVSFFFRYCWIYRIPFFYFLGINAIRLYYQHWLITPEQLEMHHVFIIFTLMLYAYGFIKIALSRSKICSKTMNADSQRKKSKSFNVISCTGWREDITSMSTQEEPALRTSTTLTVMYTRSMRLTLTLRS